MHVGSIRHATARAMAVPGLLAVLAAGAAAETRPPPQGEPVLTVAGSIGWTNGDAGAVFDREMLAALPQSGFSTGTVWTDGVSRFDGVMLAALLAELGVDIEAGGGVVSVFALDGYLAEIPFDEIGPDAPLLATHRDGAPMPLRDKGPIWLVYPYDANPDYRSDTIYARSVWQIERIEIRDRE